MKPSVTIVDKGLTSQLRLHIRAQENGGIAIQLLVTGGDTLQPPPTTYNLTIEQARLVIDVLRDDPSCAALIPNP